MNPFGAAHLSLTDRQISRSQDILAAARNRGWKFTAKIVLSPSTTRYRDSGTESPAFYFLAAMFIYLILLSFAHSHACRVYLHIISVRVLPSVLPGLLGQAGRLIQHCTKGKLLFAKQESLTPHTPRTP